MRFYYINGCGDEGYFNEKNLVKAIYTAWNIEADLYLLNDGLKKISNYTNKDECKLVFAPQEENEFNSELLEEFGYYMIDGIRYREIRRIKDDVEEKYQWNELKQLI